MPQAKKETASEVYLQKAVLEDYRTIRKLEAAFLPGLNIIIGKNGTGKTNLMKYLYRALSFGGEQQLLNAKITFAKASSSEAPSLRIFRKVQYETDQVNILKSSRFAYHAETRMSIGKDDLENIDELSQLYSLLFKHKYTYSTQLIRHGIPGHFYFFDEPFDYSGPSAELNSKLLSSDSPLIMRFIPVQLLFLPREEGKEAEVKHRLKGISDVLKKLKEPLEQLSVIEDMRLVVFQG